jgi:hypothetical protein
LNISHIFERKDTSIALLASAWNIINSIAIFYSTDLFTNKTIKLADYYYRIVANIMAMVINIILIARLLVVPGELRFALITIYVGMQ